jgi:hypothetical protein
MRHHHDQNANTIFLFYPLLHDGGSQCGKVVKQMAVLLKDGPQDPRHRKNKAGIWNIRERRPLPPKPQQRGAIPATRACSRLASVVKQFLFVL